MVLAPLWLLRAAGTIAWLVAVAGQLADVRATAGIAELVVRFVPLVVFLPILWWLLGAPRGGRVGLVVLALIAGLIHPDLQYTVAAALPLVLPVRRAAAWLAVSALAGAPWVVYVISRDPAGNGLTDTGAGAYAMVLAGHLGWQLFAFAIGLIAATERDQRRETARLNAELIATQGMLAESARAADRRELSRELHDALGHHLAGLGVQLELAKQLAAGPARDAIDDARGAAARLAGELRTAVGALRDRTPIDLRGALATLARGTREPRLHLRYDDAVQIAQPARAHALFRCAQEAITNAIRHAGARNVWLEVARADAGIALAVWDDGRAPAVLRPGHGIRGMRERLEALGGRLAIDAAGRIRIDAWLPAEDAA